MFEEANATSGDRVIQPHDMVGAKTLRDDVGRGPSGGPWFRGFRCSLYYALHRLLRDEHMRSLACRMRE